MHQEEKRLADKAEKNLKSVIMESWLSSHSSLNINRS
jgi:hypothetical protein